MSDPFKDVGREADHHVGGKEDPNVDLFWRGAIRESKLVAQVAEVKKTLEAGLASGDGLLATEVGNELLKTVELRRLVSADRCFLRSGDQIR